jgi:hypothetical protein
MQKLRYVTATAVIALGLALAPGAIAYGAGGGHGGGFGGGFGGHGFAGGMHTGGFGGHGFAGGMHAGGFGGSRLASGVHERGFGSLGVTGEFNRDRPMLGSPGLASGVHGGRMAGRLHDNRPFLDPDEGLFGYYPSYCSQYPDWYNPAAGCYYPWYG